MTVTDPVSIHLKDLDIEEYLFLNQVVDLQVRSEGGLLGVEGKSPSVENVSNAYSCLRSTEITDERTSVGRWHMVQKPGDCGEYLTERGQGEVTVQSSRRRCQPWCSAVWGDRTHTE